MIALAVFASIVAVGFVVRVILGVRLRRPEPSAHTCAMTCPGGSERGACGCVGPRFCRRSDVRAEVRARLRIVALQGKLKTALAEERRHADVVDAVRRAARGDA